MAGEGNQRAQLYEGRMTLFVTIACLVAVNGGLIFGYDIGISRGVTSMYSFLETFFPSVESHKDESGKDQDYCKFNSEALTAVTSSLYIPATIASLGGSYVTRRLGRMPSILVSAFSFLVGSTFSAVAVNVRMLMLGRILFGVGVGFGNQAVPVYLSEMAPAKLRGELNIMFQLAIAIGIFVANTINYGTSKVVKPWGWRASLGLAGIPALLMLVGGMFLPEIPYSLIERGHTDEGRTLLQRLRGTRNVDIEFEDMVKASEQANAVKHPFRNILERRNRPQLVMAILIPFLQQLIGINVIIFYAPVLFKTIGFGGDTALYSAVITGAVKVFATLVSIFTVDRWWRKFFFLDAGVQTCISQMAIGIILGKTLSGDKELSKGFAALTMVAICIYVSSLAWSWGPLGWLVPTEIFPLETRPAGQSIIASVNLLFTFIIDQAFLAMLCHFKYGIFLCFASWIIIMSLFVYFFLPETKSVPIEEMMNVWSKHWFWRHFVTALPHQPSAVIETTYIHRINQ